MFNYLVVLSLFTFNHFGLFDLIGVRESIQIVVVPFTSLICLILILPKINRIWSEPFSIYIFVMLFFISAKNIEASLSYTLLFSLLVVSVIIVSTRIFYTRMLKAIISVILFFSLAGILQAIILMFNNDLSKDIAIFSNLYLKQDQNLFFADGPYGPPEYPEFRILGLGNGDEISFGPLFFTQLRSFLHEPSLAVAYFVLPGALSLTFDGHWKKIGLTILFFSALTFAWSVFILIPITLFSYFILRAKNPRYALLLPILGGTIFYIAVYFFIIPLNPIVDTGEYSYGIENALDLEGMKAVSNFIRLGLISNGIAIFIQNPSIGSWVNLSSPFGLYAWSAVYGGILGLVAFIALFKKIFRMICLAFQLAYKESKQKSLQYALIYAIFIEATWFNDYGFSAGFGLIVSGLAYRRLHEVINF